MADKTKPEVQVPDDNLGSNAPDALSLDGAAKEAALADGAKDDVKETGKAAHRALTDGVTIGEVLPDPYAGSDESQQYAYMIELGAKEFDDLVTKKDSPVNDVMAAGLLKLERAGQNRTPYVKTLLKRLGLKGKDIGIVTDAGPSYTNDLSNITDL
jgi:hypothetical protein